MNRVKYIVVFLLGIVSLQLKAQYSFQLVFGGHGDDDQSKVIELSNGNFLFVGTTISYDYQSYVACYTPKGELLWYKNYGYKNQNSSDEIYNVIEASDGYIYVGGASEIWNWENSHYTKFSKEGVMIYDTAYIVEARGNSSACIADLIDDSFNKTLISIGSGYDNVHYCPVLQKTRYTGERLWYKFLVNLDSSGAYKIFPTPGESGYTLLADSSGTKMLIFIDSTGNQLGRKHLFYSENICYNYNYAIDSLGSFTFLFYKDQWDTLGSILKFNKSGELIKTHKMVANAGAIFYKSINEYVLLGPNSCIVDSNFNIIQTKRYIEFMDSMDLKDFNLSKDGGIFGVGTFYGDAYNRWTWDRYDYYMFKTAPDFSLTKNVSFSRTGIKENSLSKSLIISAYPNPCSNQLTIKGAPKNSTVILYDLLGNEILNCFSTQIQTSELPTGLYIIKIMTSEGEFVHQQKLTIQHE